MTTNKTLVVGAHGKTGARVMARLKAAGLPARGVSRSTHPRFDWQQPDTWADALEGVGRAYLTYHPDLSVPAAEEDIQKFCQLAVDYQLEHVVLLSGRGEEGAARAERILRNSGLAWNVVQASWFAQNFSENFMFEGILSGELVLPAGASLEPFVDIDDIADVVVASLLEPALHNRLFEVTGPRLMTFNDCVQEIAQAAGYPITLTELPLADYIQALRAQALPSALVDLLEDLFTDLFDGRNAYTADGVREALGRGATDFSTYAAKTAAAGTWNQKAQARSAS